jgi:hypothetical protein
MMLIGDEPQSYHSYRNIALLRYSCGVVTLTAAAQALAVG